VVVLVLETVASAQLPRRRDEHEHEKGRIRHTTRENFTGIFTKHE
jgi:hypothetical protein